MANSVRDKITQMKETIIQQNEMIVTIRKQRDEFDEKLRPFATVLARTRPDFLERFGDYEDVSYPTERIEEIVNMRPTALGQYIMAACNNMLKVAYQADTNYEMIVSTLDGEIDEAMNTFQTLRVTEGKKSKAEAFRADTSRTPQVTRPQTPDASLGVSSRVDSAAPTPSSLESSSKKGKPKGTSETKKARSKTERLGDLLPDLPSSKNKAEDSQGKI